MESKIRKGLWVVAIILLLLIVAAIISIPRKMETIAFHANVEELRVDTAFEDSDLIVTVKINDSLSEENSVVVQNDDGLVADAYAIRSATVTEVIKGNYLTKEINISEPYAIKDNVLYKLDILNGSDYLQQNNTYTVFLEDLGDGLFSIKSAGLAVINQDLDERVRDSKFSNLSTFILNLDLENDVEVINNFEAATSSPIMEFKDGTIVDAGENFMYYRYIPEDVNTYIEINGYSYLIPGELLPTN